MARCSSHERTALSDFHDFEKNESGQPGDEKSVGYPLGDAMASISLISAAVSFHRKALADARSPSAHALLVASHAGFELLGRWFGLNERADVDAFALLRCHGADRRARRRCWYWAPTCSAGGRTLR